MNYEISGSFTPDQWARIANACGRTGNRDLLVSIFVQTGVDPTPYYPEQEPPDTGLRAWWRRAMG